MELFQWAKNPWGQDVLIRISWDLLYLAAAAGLVFIVGHLVFRSRSSGEQGGDLSDNALSGIPEKVTRHSFAARAFHWIMAVSMLVLLFTGFLPVVGVQFGWVTIHWVSGLVLTATVLWHIFHSIFIVGLKEIWVGGAEIQDFMKEVRYNLGQSSEKPPKPGKYPVDQRIFHHMISLATLGIIATGLLMMFRIQTPLWTRNPYILGDATWGWVYVLHGLSAVGLVTMTMAHVYFAALPEKRWMTWSMILGWITRKDFAANHDPERWVVTKSES